jgi:hypothetical protein
MRTTWIVQASSESPSPSHLRRACAEARLPFHEISVVAGAATLPSMPEVDGPIVLHGRTTLIMRALEHPTLRRGIFFDPERFTHRSYVDGYGARMLNADARVLSWADLLDEARERPGLRVFLKPNDDLKRFTGEVLTLGEAVAMYERLRGAGAALGPESEIVITEPREVDAEWRLFLVDGAVVSGSMYRPSGDPQTPPELVAFAEAAAASWAPAPVFVMDVARADGAWKIVECNCFNGSRFYLADVGRIVREVSAHQER